MAGGGNFLHRVMHYVANELIVQGLANSPAFQRFAVKSSKQIEELSAKAMKMKNNISEQAKDVAEDISESFKNRQ